MFPQDMQAQAQARFMAGQGTYLMPQLQSSEELKENQNAAAASVMSSNIIREKVVVMTREYELEGYVVFSGETDENRRLTELMNHPTRRFITMNEVTVTTRGQKSNSRKVRSMDVNLHTIQMIHPFMQGISKVFVSTPDAKARQVKEAMRPTEVAIQTDEFDLEGTLFVRNQTNNLNQNLSDYLNDVNRRYIALTNVKVQSRELEQPFSGHYAFILLRTDLMNLVNVLENFSGTYTPEKAEKLDKFREKILKQEEYQPPDYL